VAEVNNLSVAKLAVQHVQQAMTVGASNKVMDVLRSMFGPESSTACVRRIRQTEPTGDTNILKIRSIAVRATTAGCGNCGEQAAIAFSWLYDQKYGPIDYMSRTNADHAFVVIGRTGPLDELSKWGDNCVICDPWHGKAYLSSSAGKEMYGGGVLAPRSMARWEKG
jgi:hypothetical protein